MVERYAERVKCQRVKALTQNFNFHTFSSHAVAPQPASAADVARIAAADFGQTIARFGLFYKTAQAVFELVDLVHVVFFAWSARKQTVL